MAEARTEKKGKMSGSPAAIEATKMMPMMASMKSRSMTIVCRRFEAICARIFMFRGQFTALSFLQRAFPPLLALQWQAQQLVLGQELALLQELPACLRN